jgi:hypothetical protein
MRLIVLKINSIDHEFAWLGVGDILVIPIPAKLRNLYLIFNAVENH